MKEIRLKKKKIHPLARKVTLLIVSIIFILVIISTYKTMSSYIKSIDHKKNTTKELNELKKREYSINEQYNKIDSDFGIERELRNKFDISKPNEEIYVIIEK